MAFHHSGRSETAVEAAAARRKHARIAEEVALREAANALTAQPCDHAGSGGGPVSGFSLTTRPLTGADALWGCTEHFLIEE
jgi:hypothetical protein